MRKDYNIGLDIGTNSVGWAVIDDDFKLQKKNGKNMWGANLFDTGETAQKRRLSRSTRRRYNKRRERVKLLQSFFEPLILPIDSTFFIRMEHTSFLNTEDKKKYLKDSYSDNYNLFVDQNFNDKDYFSKYPTIYHLRNELANSNDKIDPRLIYLALHHIVKYRGNFLYEGQTFTIDSSNIIDKMIQITTEFDEINQTEIFKGREEKILEIVSEDVNKKIRIDEVVALLNPADKNEKDFVKNFATALVGGKFNVSKLFLEEDISNDGEDIKMQLSAASYEDDLEKYSGNLSEHVEKVSLMKDVNSWVTLKRIVKTENGTMSISSAMIDRYEKHKSDLKLLKKLLKDNSNKEYDAMFKAKSGKSYYSYIHNASKCTKEDFYKNINSILDKVPDCDEKTYCLKEMENENFLRKQNDTTNGDIPYQLQLDELNKILDNQGKYYPVLKDNKDKIVSILTFRIPYYVGPLNSNSSFSWFERQEGKDNVRITPWNFNEIIDIDKTAEEFISRMRNYCTYLPQEEVMPKKSLLISKYEVLSELNQIKIDGKKLGVDVKINILNNLFMKYKKVTEKQLIKYLRDNQICLNNEDLEITGYQSDKEFASSLEPWIDFTNLFGKVDETNFNLIEEIIYDLTIFEDKSILKRRFKDKYKFSESVVDKLLNKRYTGWSRFSKKLLDGIRCDNKIGSSVSIMDCLELSQRTFMELINDDKLGYKAKIEKYNSNEIDSKITYKEIEELQGSPAIKKGIWQSIKIIQEIEKIMKNPPQNIYLEFAREESTKKRTDTRLKKMKKIYSDLSLQTKQDKAIRASLKDEKTLNNERLYLYYTQMGKCMYSNEPLDIDLLSTYQVDHILPQSLITDNSIDNKVLVKAKYNQEKKDFLVLPEEDRRRMQDNGRWKYLFDNKLISQKKYFNLIRADFNKSDIEHFIARQLVETRQITKHVANLLMNHYKDTTKVITVRANLSSEFRKKYDIVKNRNVNDYHHAHDAYIACIMGKYISKRYPKLDKDYIYGEYTNFKKNKNSKNGFILNSMDKDYVDLETGEVIWQKDRIGDIKKAFNYKDCYITKKLEEFDGPLFDLTIYSNDNNSDKGTTVATIPVNKYRNDVTKYGGFSGVKSFAVAIEAIKNDKKSSVERKVISIPLIYKAEFKDNYKEIICNKYDYSSVKILKYIKRNQLIESEHSLFMITSASELVNAEELWLNQDMNKLVHDMNYAIKINNFDDIKEEDLVSLYKLLADKMKERYSKYTGISHKLIGVLDAFKDLPVKDKCLQINQILIILKFGTQNAHILIGDYRKDRQGRLNGVTINLDNIYFFDQSVTGMYYKKYKL
ncbi:MAG: type II CRISPR RNA-guided endonuclease Cas9 [Thomasclavelia sp.]|nr:type II CRISPR RNA-guided endonuclease Cas9 [Thomasclavelia sp.]